MSRTIFVCWTLFLLLIVPHNSQKLSSSWVRHSHIRHNESYKTILRHPMIEGRSGSYRIVKNMSIWLMADLYIPPICTITDNKDVRSQLNHTCCRTQHQVDSYVVQCTFHNYAITEHRSIAQTVKKLRNCESVRIEISGNETLSVVEDTYSLSAVFYAEIGGGDIPANTSGLADTEDTTEALARCAQVVNGSYAMCPTKPYYCWPAGDLEDDDTSLDDDRRPHDQRGRCGGRVPLVRGESLVQHEVVGNTTAAAAYGWHERLIRICRSPLALLLVGCLLFTMTAAGFRSAFVTQASAPAKYNTIDDNIDDLYFVTESFEIADTHKSEAKHLLS